ncbi:hypothetical protein FA743_17465 [Paracoccus gahaiensis]|uniref:Alginate export domain-containing protein n=1 Tax=Paracoccus gahaiensis TaxID=1706839 RepID=A0A4U0R4N1_9RHOB|nr:alginate export family protein [Paracoccus gahaiensis]TJZ89873.1 hypothetical protein FA743_17465 [Paracoccus gahaiensis]
MVLPRRLLLAAALSIPAPLLAGEDLPPLMEFRPLLKVDLAYERETEEDDRAGEAGVKPLVRLIAEVASERTWSGFTEIDLFSERIWERGEDRATTNTARINQAYLRYDGAVELRVGRWLYRDEREWLIDENIDGVLARVEMGKVRVDALAGRVGWVPRELFEPDSRGDRIAYAGLLAEVEAADDIHVAGFALLGDDRERGGGEQLSLGLRSWGELDAGISYWADAGLSRGEAEGRRLKGYGFDLGATRLWEDHDLQPRLTLGWAQGSGDGDPSDGTDRTYRQTGLQSNEGRLGGFAKLKYYGEALDPDLGNLRIATAAVGVTPGEHLSIDLVYHHYRLLEAAGGEAHLGDAIDLVLGFRPTDALEVDAAFGWFSGGDGDTAPQRAFAGRIEVEYAF